MKTSLSARVLVAAKATTAARATVPAVNVAVLTALGAAETAGAKGRSSLRRPRVARCAWNRHQCSHRLVRWRRTCARTRRERVFEPARLRRRDRLVALKQKLNRTKLFSRKENQLHSVPRITAGHHGTPAAKRTLSSVTRHIPNTAYTESNRPYQRAASESDKYVQSVHAGV